MTLLFGNLLGISAHLIKMMACCRVVNLIALSVMARPLLFSSLEPELAKGISLPCISILFMVIVVMAVTIKSQVARILLVFTLLIVPATAALNWTHGVTTRLLLTVFLGMLSIWIGIILAFITD